jgi:hypothetical protein
MAKSKGKDKDKLKLISPKFRGSFVVLRKPRSFGDSEPKFSITMVLKEDDPFWKKLKAACHEAALKRWDKLPKNLKLPIRDGSETEYDDWQGCMFARCDSEERPGIVDADLEDLTDPAKLYSGAWYRVSIRPYAWHFPQGNKKGVSLQLDNVMFVRDDDPFSGRASATDDFADFVDEGGGDGDEDEDSALD